MNEHELEQFRQQAKALLTLSGPIGNSPRVVEMKGRRVILADRVSSRDGYSLQDALVVRGSFTCGTGSRFDAPVYAGGACEIGKNSRLHSIATDGRLRLATNAQVNGCAWSAEPMELRPDSWVESATSPASIQIADSAGARELFSPVIASQDQLPDLGEPAPPVSHMELPPPHWNRLPQFEMLPGFRQERLSALDDETWYYDGNLTFPFPLLLRGNLVVKGLFRCSANSLLEFDVKSGGSLHVGAGSICRGQLTSLADMVLGDGCLFSGSLKARASLRLCSGVRGFRRGTPVEAETNGTLHFEPNVVVRGHLTGGGGVRCCLPEAEGSLRLLMAESG